MARGEYYVSREDDRWKVEHNGISVTFESPGALTVALKEANQAGTLGLVGRVLIKRHDGQWQTEWVYGVDPVPVAA